MRVELPRQRANDGEQIAERGARARRDLVGLDDLRRRRHQRHLPLARPVVQRLHRRLADAAPRRVDDPLEGEVVGRRHVARK